MSFSIKQYIEKKFREARSSDELFDSFQQALKHKLKDADLYKIMLANVALSTDEIKMFTEKLCAEFEDLRYDIYMWTASILESSLSMENMESAFNYYLKASLLDLTNDEPFLSIIRMYNANLDLPPKERIIGILEVAVKEVKKKSHLYKEMAEFYGSLGNDTMKRRCMTLAAKFGRNEGK